MGAVGLVFLGKRVAVGLMVGQSEFKLSLKERKRQYRTICCDSVEANKEEGVIKIHGSGVALDAVPLDSRRKNERDMNHVCLWCWNVGLTVTSALHWQWRSSFVNLQS